MAQTGYTPISIYYSSTASNVPTAGNLVAGELAINTADGKLFYKDSSGVVQTIAQKGVGVSSFSAGTTGLTPNTATTGVVTLAGTLAVANGGTGGTTSTGSGAVVLATSPTLVTPALGTPSAINLTNATALPYAALPAGSVLQVVNATSGTTVTTSANTLIDTGLTATITPKFATSKILVIIHQPIRVNSAQVARFYLNRAGTNIVQLWQGWGYISAISAQMSTTYLDSPATTSATTYKTQFSNPSASGTIYVSPDGSSDLSTITLMEIAA